MDNQVYLLAAGDGKRAGGPKAWLELGGRPLIERQIEFLLRLFPPERIAVSIQAGWEARTAALHPAIHWVAEDPESSPLAALQALFRAVPPARLAFVFHVDMPVWEPELFRRLAARAAAASGVEAFAPRHVGRKGHPILLSPGLAGPLAALDPAKDRLDHWLRTRREEAVDLPFDCIHANWNDGIPARAS